MKNQISKQNQRGRSMIEMLSVLAIIAIISVGGYAGYTLAMEKYRLKQTIDAVYTLVNDTRAAFKKQGNYKGLGNYSTDAAYNEERGYDENSPAAKIIKKSGVNPPYIIRLEGEGDFWVDIVRIQKSICAALATHDWKFGSDFTGMTLNWETYKKSYTIAEANELCKIASDMGGAMVNFEFLAPQEFYDEVGQSPNENTKPICGYPGLPLCPKGENPYEKYCEVNPDDCKCGNNWQELRCCTGIVSNGECCMNGVYSDGNCIIQQ